MPSCLSRWATFHEAFLLTDMADVIENTVYDACALNLKLYSSFFVSTFVSGRQTFLFIEPL